MAQTDLIGDEAFDTTLLGERTFGWGTFAQRPSSNFHANGFYIATDTGVIYQNTGSEATPSWTEVLQAGNLLWVLALGD